MAISSIYTKSDGLISRMVDVPDYDLPHQFNSAIEETLPGRYNGNTHYVLNGAPTERPTITATLDKNSIVSGGEIAILSGLPIPCTVTVADRQYTVNDGSFEFTLPLPGEYTITVEGFPYLSKTYEVTAT